MPTGACSVVLMMAAATGGDVAASGSTPGAAAELTPCPPQDRADIERGRWARVGLRGPLGDHAPPDIHEVAQSLKAGRHQEREVQARALPMIHWAIESLADDDVKYNAHGAEHFLRLAGPLAVPFLEMAIVTGDMQQRSSASFLLLGARDVSDPQAVADALVQSMRDDNYGHPVANCGSAFRILAVHEALFEAARPALLRALDDRDIQLRLNAAQILCIHGSLDRVDRIVDILAPMLDDDEHGGNAKSAMASLGLLGIPAMDRLRDLRDARDEQGRALTDGVIHDIAGPHVSNAVDVAYTRFNPTCLTHHPARDVGCIHPLGVDPTDGLWGECGMGPWMTRDWSTGWWWYWDSEREQFDVDKIDLLMQRWVERSPERVARARLEAMCASLPPRFRGHHAERVRERFEAATRAYRLQPWPEWAPMAH